MYDDEEDMRGKKVLVWNSKKVIYCGIMPQETGFVDYDLYRSYSFALKRVKPSFIENAKPNIENLNIEDVTELEPVDPIPTNFAKDIPFHSQLKILRTAIVETIGSPNNAALLLEIPKKTFEQIGNKKTRNVIPKGRRYFEYHQITKVLNETQKSIFIEKVNKLCVEYLEQEKSLESQPQSELPVEKTRTRVRKKKQQ